MRVIHSQPQIRIGHVIRNAVVFNFQNWSDGLLSTDHLPKTVERLFA